MKKPVLILTAVALALSVGCSRPAEQSNDTQATAEESNTKIEFTQEDFALYTNIDSASAGEVVAGLGMAKEELVYNNNTTPYLDNLQLETKEKEVTLSSVGDGKSGKYNVIYYMGFLGGNYPISTYKDITTTGIAGESKDNCSTEEDVLKAYGIDKNNEAYKADETEDGYSITLLFNKKTEEVTEPQTDEDGSAVQQPQKDTTIERIVSPTGTDLAQVQCTYKVRFFIKDGYVYGVDMYDFSA